MTAPKETPPQPDRPRRPKILIGGTRAAANYTREHRIARKDFRHVWRYEQLLGMDFPSDKVVYLHDANYLSDIARIRAQIAIITARHSQSDQPDQSV
jgi:hypothetical protein